MMHGDFARKRPSTHGCDHTQMDTIHHLFAALLPIENFVGNSEKLDQEIKCNDF